MCVLKYEAYKFCSMRHMCSGGRGMCVLEYEACVFWSMRHVCSEV